MVQVVILLAVVIKVAVIVITAPGHALSTTHLNPPVM
jgi:hypothetical protein